MRNADLRVLTLRPDMAAAVFRSGKDVENRTWNTKYRGRLIIHAGAPIKAVLGTVNLLDVVTDSESPWAIPGQYHWLIEGPRAVWSWEVPGRQGLWKPSADLVEFLSRRGALEGVDDG